MMGKSDFQLRKMLCTRVACYVKHTDYEQRASHDTEPCPRCELQLLVLFYFASNFRDVSGGVIRMLRELKRCNISQGKCRNSC